MQMHACKVKTFGFVEEPLFLLCLKTKTSLSFTFDESFVHLTFILRELSLSGSFLFS